MAQRYLPAVSVLVLGLLILLDQCSCTEVYDDLLKCRDEVDIENCATSLLDTSISINDVFNLITTNITRVEEMCQGTNKRLYPCIEPCYIEFSSSKYGHLANVCGFLRWIRWEEECWTPQWAMEASDCYRRIYPHFSTDFPHLGLYPIPYRPYDRASIALECFPTARAADNKCSYYQTWIFQKILPHYYELHGYPEDFDHIPDSLGFPGL